MNPYLLSFLLGIVEGITEFLPVSSTAHLRIVEAFFGVNLADGYWKMFSIVIQLGAILCLPIYFGERISEFLHTFPRGERRDRTLLTHPLSLTMVAFVCTAAPAFLLTKVIGKHLESLYVMASSLIIGGVIMWMVDAMYERGRLAMRPIDRMDEMSFGQAVLDRTLPDALRRLPRNLALHVHHRRRTDRRNVALGRPRVLLLPLHPHHGRRHPATTSTSRMKHGGAMTALGSGPAGHQGWIMLAIGFCRLLLRRSRRRRLVHELGTHARIHRVRHLPHRRGIGGPLLGDKDLETPHHPSYCCSPFYRGLGGPFLA